MPSVSDVLLDAFDRVNSVVHHVVEGLTPEQLGVRVDGQANSIVWLIWHLGRIQDDHLASAFGAEQLWTADGWAQRFDLPFPTSEVGYGQTFNEVSAVQVSSGDLLTGYCDAVHAKTRLFVKPLVETDLSRVVDEAYDPPVTLSTRLVSVISDNLQHAGQAALIRGLIAG